MNSKKDQFVILLFVGKFGYSVPQMPTFSPQNLPNMMEYNATHKKILLAYTCLSESKFDKRSNEEILFNFLKWQPCHFPVIALCFVV